MCEDVGHDGGEFVPPLERLCRYLSDRSPQPMVAVEGAEHVVIYLNDAFAHLVGREATDLVGRHFAQAVPEGGGNRCVALLDRAFRTGQSEKLEEQEHLGVTPRPVYWSYSVWPILGEDEHPVGVMIQVTDSTETALFRQQMTAMNESLIVSATRQHELAETARSLGERLQSAVEARDRFLAILSHELRNPLAALSTGLQLLQLCGDDPSQAEDSSAMKGIMERQLKQLVWLVDDLLEVSRISTGRVELRIARVDLASILGDAVDASRPLIDRGGHELAVSLPPGPIMIDADPTRLTQVFLNLLGNAAKYSEPGGHIELSAWREGDEVVVKVRDSGIGIPAIDLPRVFDIFVQVDAERPRSQGGLGIGLSLVRSFVELHGGRVEARSEGPGMGSEFIVRLPAKAETRAAEPSLPRLGGPRGPRRRILVVDDNRDAAESLARLLHMMGHEVRTAHGGDEGVASAAGFRPDVVLMDLGMPTVDGYEAARRIRAGPKGREPFLIAITGWGADADRKRTQDAGFDRHLVKPVNTSVLMQLFADLATRST
ncbi:MAG: hybrid sensor histidine kinase/response regulator [Isosphaeraceae bacterium]